jgi:hypothetical protein
MQQRNNHLLYDLLASLEASYNIEDVSMLIVCKYMIAL